MSTIIFPKNHGTFFQFVKTGTGDLHQTPLPLVASLNHAKTSSLIKNDNQLLTGFFMKPQIE